MSTKTTKLLKENEHYKLLQSARNEYKKENYSASVCSLTSIIDHCGQPKNEQVQLLVIETKIFNSKLKESARNHLMHCYYYGIGIKKDVSKVEELY
ncbi:45348_t:CDS:2 [Gigaspora margarita]|uniref:45348_t:CDS:1 n=1 Tax=Gigaspora margarita TaxID=4874 RepID=A0ABN7VN51_GIGMA|nr:45348_t:CDS:2 [Gigaspora margarita]